MKSSYPPVKQKFFAFNGGLDLTTPPIEIKNGVMISGSNVEIGINGGYQRIAGYERFDGRPRPSDALYYILTATITGSYAAGDTLTGATSGTTAIICTTGTVGYFVLTKLAGGAFQNGENLQISGSTVAVSTGAANQNAASTMALNATYTNLAASQYRSDIQKVPGSGSILGVWLYNGVVYAFRNNVGGTAAAMYASSGSGWTAVTMYNEVSFTVGNVATPVDGATLTQGGVTATVKRVVTQSGAWAGTAAGRFIVTNPAGGNFAAGAATLTGGATVTLSAIQTAITLAVSGRYEFQNYNFGGQLGTKRMYGCDGKNRAFEFDGTVFVPLVTGMAADTPTHLRVHKFQLFVSFGGSAQHSGIGNPYTWTIISGAGELAIGDTITGFLSLPGSATTGTLAIYARNSTYILYGTSSSDWNLVPFDPEAGSLEWSPQYITQGVSLDDKGIILLSTTQAYGNFQSAAVSNTIKPYLADLIATVSSSCIVRTKNQYRLFFSGGSAVFMTFGGQTANPITGTGSGIYGMTTVSYPDPVLVSCSLKGSSGTEEMYFGSSSGYVFQMDKGTSFDGAVIPWNVNLSYNHCGSPRLLKEFQKAATEVSGSAYCEFSFTYSLGYGKADYDVAPSNNVVTSLSGTNWDSFTWDQFFWDGTTLIPSEAEITGSAENIALIYQGSSAEFQPFKLNGAIMHFIERRSMR